MTSVTSHSKSDFRKVRSKGIGASEVAAVIGVDPYRTPYRLWEEKTGKVPHFEGNKFTRAGHKLEPVIVEYFQEDTGVQIEDGHELNITYFHPMHEYIFCTPDRPYLRDGRKGALECKSTQKRIDGKDLPLQWMAQNQYQIGICGFDEGAVAWLERGLDFGYAYTEFNPQLFDALVNEVGEFWHKYVLSDTPPPPANSDDIQRMYDAVPGKSVTATPETYDAYLKLVDVREKMAELKAEKEELEEQFKMMMKEAESVTHNGETLVTWKQSTATRLNQKTFKREQELLYDYYSYQSETRRFLVK